MAEEEEGFGSELACLQFWLSTPENFEMNYATIPTLYCFTQQDMFVRRMGQNNTWNV